MINLINDLDLDKQSPFQPGIPVSPENFKGRQQSIQKILRYAKKATTGQMQHFFLTGKRRMGKTSLTDYVKDIAKTELNMLSIYVSNKGNSSVDQLTLCIFESLLNEIPKDSLKDKAATWFSNHVESIDLKGVKVSIKPNEKFSRDLKDFFADYLNEIYHNELSNKYKGILIIIDDINGLSNSNNFVNWYKRLADTVSINSRYNLPVYLLLAGYPEKYDSLVQMEESFGSIFNHENIAELKDEEVKEFFLDTFKREKIDITPEALNHMVNYSSGLPLMMQQIGDSIYWQTEKNIISEKDAIKGIFDAADEIGTKQIRPMLNQIQSENYIPMLEILAKNKLKSFKRSQLNKLAKLTKSVLDNFLSRMVELGILEQTGQKNSGMYRFSNTLYYIYFVIKNLEKENNLH